MSDKPDPRIQKILDGRDVTYEIDPDNDFHIGCTIEDGRAQAGFINSNTEEFAGQEIRDIWSVGYESKWLFSEKVANLMLILNCRLTTGSWSVMPHGEEYLAIFKIQVPADADEETVFTALLDVVTSADKMKNMLTHDEDGDFD